MSVSPQKSDQSMSSQVAPVFKCRVLQSSVGEEKTLARDIDRNITSKLFIFIFLYWRGTTDLISFLSMSVFLFPLLIYTLLLNFPNHKSLLVLVPQ